MRFVDSGQRPQATVSHLARRDPARCSLTFVTGMVSTAAKVASRSMLTGPPADRPLHPAPVRARFTRPIPHEDMHNAHLPAFLMRTSTMRRFTHLTRSHEDRYPAMLPASDRSAVAVGCGGGLDPGRHRTHEGHCNRGGKAAEGLRSFTNGCSAAGWVEADSAAHQLQAPRRHVQGLLYLCGGRRRTGQFCAQTPIDRTAVNTQ